jgi:hypothetical protein
MNTLRPLALACAFLVVSTGGFAQHRLAAAAERLQQSPPAPAELISIRAEQNGLLVSVTADGTLAPVSAFVGITEQFQLHEVAHGLIALQAVATGRFVTARILEPLRADAEQIGELQLLRPSGGNGFVRLRSPSAKGVVCVGQIGQVSMVVARRCPHTAQLLRFEPIETTPPPFTITAPSPGSVLTATSVTFQWDGNGDEYRLKIGSVPGASDIYDSGPLGPASQHTVAGLPLNGQKLYVQVARRIATVIDHVDAEYTAPIRKGLAIVADFANRRLEDWTGAGFRTLSDLGVQLSEMERHWMWLSRNTETFHWDVIRIQLPRDAGPDAYPNWIAFREAIAALALQQVAASDYDVNGDSVIDAAWIIVSSGMESVPFAIGGTSANGGMCMFVDGQASGSVQAGATGNFNHELGHCIGLPDMYGTYSTLNKLTLMNDSWALPPQDFSVYERVALGWVKPQRIETTTYGVWLPSANEVLAAAMLPTVRSGEYFLLEYRNPPATGYGSATQGYRGLAVYHVLSGSSMWQDPPLVKLEPADGTNAPNQPLDPNDFLYPGNPGLTAPFIARSYYDDRDAVFRIENLAWRDGGLAFDVVILGQPPPSPAANLLVNGSFEAGQAGTPEGWLPGWFVPQDAQFVWPESIASDGTSSASLHSTFGNDIRWWQEVATTPGEHYQLCGVLKGASVAGVQGEVGANVSVIGGFVRSNTLSGTFDWTKACVDFVAETPRVEVACRLGFYGSTASGTLWCDDFTLAPIRLHSAFEALP